MQIELSFNIISGVNMEMTVEPKGGNLNRVTDSSIRQKKEYISGNGLFTSEKNIKAGE